MRRATKGDLFQAHVPVPGGNTITEAGIIAAAAW